MAIGKITTDKTSRGHSAIAELLVNRCLKCVCLEVSLLVDAKLGMRVSPLYTINLVVDFIL